MGNAIVLGAFFLFATFLPAQNQSSKPTNPQQSETAASAIVPVSDIARLHVYRARRYVGSALAPTITIDGKPVARVGSGRRVTIRLTPGPHTITSDDKSSSVAIEAKAGQDYYIRVDEETGFWKGHGRLTLLMPEQGGAEYKLQKPVESDRRVAPEMIEEDSADRGANQN